MAAWEKDNSPLWRGCSKSLDLAQRAFDTMGWDRDDVVEGLCHAAFGGKLNVVEWICDTAERTEGLQMVNETSGLFGMSPVSLAAAEGHLEVVQWLVDKGSKLNAKDRVGRTELHAAASGGHLSVLKWLVEKGGCASEKDVGGDTALHEAAESGHLTTVKFLVDKDACISETNECGETAWDLAAIHGHFAVVQFLGEAANQVVDTEMWRNTALFRGIRAHKMQFLEFFLQDCVVEPRGKYWSSVFSAATHAGIDVFAYLDSEFGLFTFNNNGRSALHVAASAGNIHLLEFLLGKGADVSRVDAFGVTPAIEACRHGHLGVLLLLIRDEANLTTADVTGQTALHFACKSGQVRVVRALLQHGVDVNCCDQHRWTPLHHAVAVGKNEIVELLVRRGARLDAETDSSRTALSIAREHVHVDMAQYLKPMEQFSPVLIGKCRKNTFPFVTSVVVVCRQFFQVYDYQRVVRRIGCFVDSSLQCSFSQLRGEALIPNEQVLKGSNWGVEVASEALLAAAFKGELEVVARLASTPINENDGNGQTALHWAVKAQVPNLPLIKFLVSRGARAFDQFDKWGNTALFYAAVEHKLQIVEFLLKRKYSENKGPSLEDKRKSLFAAAKAGRVDLVDYLKCTIIIRCANSIGRSALHEAAGSGSIQCVNRLLVSGADVHQTDILGVTPVIEACRHGQNAVLNRLLGCKANVSAVDMAGRTALHYAAERGHMEVIKTLLAHGVDVDCSDKFGWTPMHCAAAAGYLEVMKLLLDNGADVDSETISGMTAKILVVERGHYEVPDEPVHVIVQSDYNEYIIRPSDIPLFMESNFYWLSVPVEVKAKTCRHSNLIEELDRWSKLSHPNVVRLFGVWCSENDDKAQFVSEFSAPGSLSENLDVAPATLWKRLYEAAVGLEYLHGRNIIHGQLNCESIVLAENGLAKLRNFGMEDTSRLEWTAPELLFGAPLSFQSDIYAFGITIVEAFTNGGSPWGFTGSVLKDAIQSGKLPDKPSQITTQQWMLVERMCCFNPRDRLSAQYIARQLKMLLDEYSTPSEPSSSPAVPNETPSSWDNLSGVMIGLTTVAALLADVDEMCRNSTEINAMFLEVHKRLDDILSQLNARYKTLSGVIVHRYCIILLYCHRQMTRLAAAKLTPEEHFVAHRQVLNDVFALHKDLDVLLNIADLPPEVGVHEWRTIFKSRCGQQSEGIKQTIGTLLNTKMHGEAQREEALICIWHELQKPSTQVLTSNEVAISEAKALLTSQWTPKLPEWFIPRYDVVFDALCQFNDGDVGCACAGKWNQVQVWVEKVGMYLPVCYVETWYKLRHLHVVKLFGACHIRQPFLVCEYTREQLDEYVRRHPDKIWETLYEAALGLRYLHSKDVVHGNLNDTSIVVGTDGHVKLTKLFFINIKHDQKQHNKEPESEKDCRAKTLLTDKQWNAPELLDEARATVASDIYSFGIFILHVVNTMVASQVQTDENHMRLINELVAKMTDCDPPGRPSASEVVRRLEVFTAGYQKQEAQVGDDVVPVCWSSLGGFRICPGKTAVTVSSLLAEIDVACATRDVYERLVDIFSQLKARDGQPSKKILQQFSGIIVNFHKRPVSQEQGYTASVHRALDWFMLSFRIPRSDQSHQWQGELELAPIEETHESVMEPFPQSKIGSDQTKDSMRLSDGISASCSGNTAGDSLTADYVVSALSVSKNDGWFIPEHEVAFVDTNAFSRGGFGKVFYGKWRRAGVVVKTVALRTEKEQAAFLNEVEIWHKLSHPHVAQLFGACHIQRPFFVCEHAKGGQLDTFLKSHPGEVWDKLYEAALGLQYLHEMGVIHGDLKCNNILVGSDGLAKLIDFGLSRIGPCASCGNNEICNKPATAAIWWMAPEAIKGKKMTFASDIYAFGMCILEATSGARPWGHLGPTSVRRLVLKEQTIPMRPLKCSETMYRQVERMCAFKPEERISAADVVRRLGIFTQKSEGPGKGVVDLTQLDEMPKAWVNLEDALVTTPSTETTISSLLAKIDGMCEELTTIDEMNLAVRNRLKTVFSRLESGLTELTQDTVRQYVRQYGAILYFFYRELEKMRLSGVIFVTISRVSIETTHSVHDDVDLFMETAPLSWTISDWKWRDQWERCRREVQIEAFEELKHLPAILKNMDTEKRNELVELVRFELTTHPSTFAECNAAEVTLLKREIFSLLPSEMPDWFIPAFEVDISYKYKIGAGGFADVYHGEWKHTPVAVKAPMGAMDSTGFSSFSLSNSRAPLAGQREQDTDHSRYDIRAPRAERKQDIEPFLQEVHIWYKLCHPHVVQLYGACHIGSLFFVCEYAEGGELRNYLKTHRNEVWQKLLEAARGLQYLHSKSVIHNDVKCNNIVVGSDGCAKITDFGLSTLSTPTIGPKKEEHFGILGAIQWKAPEVLRGEESTFASDIYSFGMCILEAVSGEMPWGGLPNTAVKFHVVHGKLPMRPAGVTDEMYALVERMCRFEPSERLTAKEVVDSWWGISRLAERTLVRPNFDVEEAVISSSTDITPQHISQVNAHQKLVILPQRIDRNRIRVKEQHRHLNEKLQDVSEAQVRASSKLTAKVGEMQNQEHELARQTNEMDSVRAQIRHEDAEIVRLQHEMRRQEERQQDGLLSIIPVYGIVNAIIKNDAKLSIPGCASIDALLSAIRGDLASSQERLNRTQQSVNQLQQKAAETQSEIDRLAVDMSRFQSEMEMYDTSIRSTGRDLCTVNEFRSQVLSLQSKFQFLRDDIDLLQELGDVISVKDECVEDLRCLSLAL